jgi:hypothetical protein
MQTGYQAGRSKREIRLMERYTAGRESYSDLVINLDVALGTGNSALVSKIEKDSTSGVICSLVGDRKGEGKVPGRVRLEHKVVCFATTDVGAVVVEGIENLSRDESEKTGQGGIEGHLL